MVKYRLIEGKQKSPNLFGLARIWNIASEGLYLNFADSWMLKGELISSKTSRILSMQSNCKVHNSFFLTNMVSIRECIARNVCHVCHSLINWRQKRAIGTNAGRWHRHPNTCCVGQLQVKCYHATFHDHMYQVALSINSQSLN